MAAKNGKDGQELSFVLLEVPKSDCLSHCFLLTVASYIVVGGRGNSLKFSVGGQLFLTNKQN